MNQTALKRDDLDSLVTEFYAVKKQLRDFAHTHWRIRGENTQRKKALARKNELLLGIKQELNNVSESKAKEIRSRLYEGLGVIV